MRTADPFLPVVFDRSEALGAGLSSGQVQRRLAGGQWNRLRWGRFAVAGMDEDRRWRAEVIAIVRSHRRSLILSHAHAARAWRLPCPRGDWGPLTFTSLDRPVSTSGGMKVLNAPLPEDDLAPMGQVVVTSPARTVLDCARSLPPRDALAMADAALRTRLCDRADLDAVRDRMSGWPGPSTTSAAGNSLRRAGVLVVRWTARDVLDDARSRSLAADLHSAIGRVGRFASRVILL